jgi:hypothetical protein
MQNASPIMGNYEEAVQHAKGQCRHSEEVHRGDGFPMIAQKGRPWLCRLRGPRRSAHPAQGCPLRNIKAKHRQLAVDARSAPGWVLYDHTKDELAEFDTDALPA